MTTMHTGMLGLSLIRSFEGLRLAAYRCPAGVWTIGYGHTGPDVHQGLVITRERAEQLLVQDLRRFEQAVNRLVDVPLTQNQFDALVSFAFNVGVTNFGASSVLRYVNANRMKEVPIRLALWVNANGKKLSGLVRRRAAEGDLFQRAPVHV